MGDAKSENLLNNSLIEDLRTFIGIFGSISGVCYVIGFMIVNIYLGQYGVHDLALIRPQYFAAGLLYFLLSALLCSVPLISVYLFRDMQGKGFPFKTGHIFFFLFAN